MSWWGLDLRYFHGFGLLLNFNSSYIKELLLIATMHIYIYIYMIAYASRCVVVCKAYAKCNKYGVYCIYIMIWSVEAGRCGQRFG